MCGIAGHVGRKLDGARLQRMADALAHRGPEDEGFFEFPASGADGVLVHRRLRIIDLSPAGHQPMFSADGTLAVVFNGEIYNFRELRRVLENEGYRFRSTSDTEVILQAYARWGADCVERLHGMFALALWDAARQELLLARDRVGKKPLFYRADSGSFTFGSEIKALLAAMGKTPGLDYESLDDYLTYLYVPYPRTIFASLRQLPPATRMRVAAKPGGRIETETVTYWNPLAARAPANRRVEDLCEEVRARVGDAVTSRLISDVPLGVLLSGGMDSSTIAAVMAGASREPVRSFSVGFAGYKHYDEIPFAKMVAERFGCRHEILEAEPAFSKHLARIVWHFDQPFGNPTSILTYKLSQMTRRSVTVALAGDGGDELFGGYPRYVGAHLSRLPRSLPGFVRNRVLPWIGRRISDASSGRHNLRRMREFLESAGQPLIEAYLNWIGYFSQADKTTLYASDMALRTRGRDAGDFLRELYRQGESLEPVNRLAFVDIKSFLCCNVLEYADRMSMAHALELRAPFTDHRLVELALQLPFEVKFRRGDTKWILKKAMHPLLPAEVLSKPKVGFNPPVAAWLHGELRPLAEELLSPESLRARGLFEPAGVRGILDLHLARRRDYSLHIWALMILEIWFRIYMDGRVVESVQEEIDRVLAGGTPASAPLTAATA